MNIVEKYGDHKSRYYAWMFERQRIWYKRYMERSPAPWTDDPILSSNRFTNTYRELDRGTKYALQIVLPDKPRDTFWSVFMRTLIYRVFNKVSTYDKVFREVVAALDTTEAWEAARVILNELHDSGEPIFTRAHVVPTFGAVAADKERKSDKIIEFLEDVWFNWQDRLTPISHLPFKDAHKLLMTLPHIGDFTAYEILSDLAYTPWVAFDENDWANAGPGAIAGLKLVFYEDTIEKQKSYLDLMIQLRDNQDIEFASLGLPIWLFIGPGVHNPRLTLRNIEGGLCEYYKYNSVVNGKNRLPFRVGEGYVWQNRG